MAQKNKLGVTLSRLGFLFCRRGRRQCCSVFYSVSCIFIITKLRLINRCIGLAHSRSFNVSMRKYCVCVTKKNSLFVFAGAFLWHRCVCVCVRMYKSHVYNGFPF